MGAIRLTQFSGIIPRTSGRLIPDNAAQLAINCDFSDGELRPLNAPKKIYTSAKTGPLLTIYRITENSNYAWLTWPYDVDVVKAPLYGTAKWCFTGDGEPRITNMASAISGNGNDYPHTAYTLGVPKPITAPSVSHSGGTGSAESRYYAYTFRASWDGVEFEGAVSPLSTLVNGKVDGTWAITGMDASPPNNGTVTGSFSSGETTFTSAIDTFLRTGEQVVISGTTMTVTVLTSKIFKVAGNYSSATSWARKAPFTGTITKCLYRTSGTAAQFQLVAENIIGTTYNDTLTASQIPGDELISADWDMPPVGLTGLFMLPSGALAGFDGIRLKISEPYQPHAWPSSYDLTADFPIKAAASFGTGVVCATESRPFIVTGVDPGQMSGTMWEEVLPCSSKRSMVSLGDVVLYASPSGIVAVGSSGSSIWSLGYFSGEKDWMNYNPASMVSALANRRLYICYQTGNTTRTLMFNLQGDGQYLIESHFDADDIYADLVTGRLYFSYGSDVYEFDPQTGYPMVQTWMSKEFTLPRPQNIGAAKINFNLAINTLERNAILAEISAITAANAPLLATGNVHGAWNASRYNTNCWNCSDLQQPPDNPPTNEVSFELYAGGKLRVAKVVQDSMPFSLPSGYKADTIAVQVSSQCHIKSIEIGDTKQTLAQA
jgi:hypothetical protein